MQKNIGMHTRKQRGVSFQSMSKQIHNQTKTNEIDKELGHVVAFGITPSNLIGQKYF